MIRKYISIDESIVVMGFVKSLTKPFEHEKKRKLFNTKRGGWERRIAEG